MFNMGFTELLVLAVIALIVIGPKQLPEVARVLASLINEFKRATSDLTDSITQVKSDVNSAIQDVSDEVKSGLESPEEWVSNIAQEEGDKQGESKNEEKPANLGSKHDS